SRRIRIRERRRRIEAETAEESASGELLVAEGGEPLEEAVDLLARSRPLLRAEQARRLLGGDLLGSHQNLLRLATRLILPPEHRAHEVARRGVLRESPERVVRSHDLRGAEGVLFGTLESLARGDLLLQGIDGHLEPSRARHEERRALRIAHPTDRHETTFRRS